MNSASPKKLDDPFGSDDEDLNLMHKEWSRVDGGLKTAGIRDGLESSQECVLQESFNAAFRNSLKMAVSAGKLQGGISALLSCPPQLAAGDSPGGQSNSLESRKESQLQLLLTRNENLMSGIPRFLLSDRSTAKSAGLNPESSVDPQRGTRDGDSAPVSLSPESKCLVQLDEISKDGKEGESQPMETKTSISCEDICSNKTHFWSQLESFKIQAGALGVFAPND